MTYLNLGSANSQLRLTNKALEYSKNAILELSLLYEAYPCPKHAKLLALSYLSTARALAEFGFWKKSKILLKKGLKVVKFNVPDYRNSSIFQTLEGYLGLVLRNLRRLEKGGNRVRKLVRGGLMRGKVSQGVVGVDGSGFDAFFGPKSAKKGSEGVVGNERNLGVLKVGRGGKRFSGILKHPQEPSNAPEFIQVAEKPEKHQKQLEKFFGSIDPKNHPPAPKSMIRDYRDGIVYIGNHPRDQKSAQLQQKDIFFSVGYLDFEPHNFISTSTPNSSKQSIKRKGRPKIPQNSSESSIIPKKVIKSNTKLQGLCPKDREHHYLETIQNEVKNILDQSWYRLGLKKGENSSGSISRVLRQKRRRAKSAGVAGGKNKKPRSRKRSSKVGKGVSADLKKNAEKLKKYQNLGEKTQKIALMAHLAAGENQHRVAKYQKLVKSELDSEAKTNQNNGISGVYKASKHNRDQLRAVNGQKSEFQSFGVESSDVGFQANLSGFKGVAGLMMTPETSKGPGDTLSTMNQLKTEEIDNNELILLKENSSKISEFEALDIASTTIALSKNVNFGPSGGQGRPGSMNFEAKNYRITVPKHNELASISSNCGHNEPSIVLGEARGVGIGQEIGFRRNRILKQKVNSRKREQILSKRTQLRRQKMEDQLFPSTQNRRNREKMFKSFKSFSKQNSRNRYLPESVVKFMSCNDHDLSLYNPKNHHFRLKKRKRKHPSFSLKRVIKTLKKDRRQLRELRGKRDDVYSALNPKIPLRNQTSLKVSNTTSKLPEQVWRPKLTLRSDQSPLKAVKGPKKVVKFRKNQSCKNHPGSVLNASMMEAWSQNAQPSLPESGSMPQKYGFNLKQSKIENNKFFAEFCEFTSERDSSRQNLRRLGLGEPAESVMKDFDDFWGSSDYDDTTES